MENHHYNSCWHDTTTTTTTNWPVESSFPLPWQLPVPPPHGISSASSSSIQFQEFPSSWSIPVAEEVAEEKAASVSRSHSQAEKRRRDRINSHLATLRKLIPKSEKMDKAALLGSVIEHVKDLKLRAMEISKTVTTVPTEVDEITVDFDDADRDAQASSTLTNGNEIKTRNLLIKASVCCEDQPELFRELIRALKNLKLTTIRADIASVGGRIKSVLVLCNQDSDQESLPLTTLKQSLHLVLNRISSSSSSSSVASYCRIRSKRQRLLLSSHHLSE
ncbi:hypothetical protein ACOSQ2_032581 [Xanthoceras sorbifolium]|uniref:BHLH domain-containing protein n=1 Tax=Xanthoceras sorbifolium TaxID=99658 RepID=A0ABQ8H4V9_9ROSI|nr:hypothetical protein JRO89_XS14G0106200 [Xanthoceras sorbifolium]